MVRGFVVVVAVLSAATALEVTSPPHLVGHIPTVLYNYKLGLQLDPKEDHDLGVEARLVVVNPNVCDNLRDVNATGAIVLIDSDRGRVRRLEEERKDGLCIERAGGIAVLRSVGHTGVPGIFYNWNQHVARGVGIPFLTNAEDDARLVLDALYNGTEVTARLVVDKNEWVVFWDSAAFLACFRIILASLNLWGVMMALKALRLNYDRSVEDPRNNTTSMTIPGSLIELVAFALRGVWCAMGGFFSTSAMDYATHVYFITLTIPLEVATNLIAANMLLRWGVFGEVEMRRQMYLETFLMVLGVVMLALQLVLNYYQAFTSSDTAVFFAVNSFFFGGVTLVTIFLFFRAGCGFLHRVKSSQHRGSVGSLTVQVQRKKRVKRATSWIVASGVCQLLPLVSAVLTLNAEFLISPVGFHTSFGLLFFGLTFGALAQVFAFTPVRTGDRGVLKQPGISSL